MALLGVNIDHVATVRQARLTNEPDPIHAAVLAELGGADSITVHLREDRRHIQERDVRLLREMLRVPLNLEMAIDPPITAFACEILPHQATLVPEKREELTTEGGLDVVTHKDRVAECSRRLVEAGIAVSLFIDPDRAQIEATAEMGVEIIEIHTGAYADAASPEEAEEQLDLISVAAEFAEGLGLTVNMGHGLTYRNVLPIAQLPETHELNIGHSIIAHAMMVGMERAVSEMKSLVESF